MHKTGPHIKCQAYIQKAHYQQFSIKKRPNGFEKKGLFRAFSKKVSGNQDKRQVTNATDEWQNPQNRQLVNPLTNHPISIFSQWQIGFFPIFAALF